MPRHRHLGPAETGANLRSEIIAYAAASHPHRRGDFHAGTGTNGKIESQRSWNRPVFTQSPLSFYPDAAAPGRRERFFYPPTAAATRNDSRFDWTQRWQGEKPSFSPETAVFAHFPRLRRNRPVKAMQKIGGQQIGELQGAIGIRNVGGDGVPVQQVGGGINPPSCV